MHRFVFFIIVLAAFSANGQLSQGGYPIEWRTKGNDGVVFENLPKIDRETLDKEDEVNDEIKNIPFRFGQNIEVDFDINKSGSWINFENGDRLWRLGITSNGAQSINFVFDKYEIPEGGKVFVYDANKTQLLGSFTAANANKTNSLAVGFVMSDSIVISYFEPAEVAQKGYLHINNITHGYRNAFAEAKNNSRGVFGNSGPCHVNVNCPAGLPFDIQKRSVGLIVVNGNSKCTGALVNTTAQDGRPYFLTARHCLGNSDNWVIYFHHETPDCEGQIAAPLNYSMSGTSLLAWNEESDFALVELNENVPDTFNVCYSGWDATDNPATVLSGYGIHHPKGDVKKISIEEDTPTPTSVNSNFVNQVWFINNWEQGATESGSSGSPLFNQSGLIVGQLAGGLSMCVGENNNGKYDFYGRLGTSWNYGTTPSTRLKDWLDPIGTGEKIIGNTCAATTDVHDASLAEFSGIEETTCNLLPFEPQIRVLNSGTVPISNLKLEINFNGSSQIVSWQGSIDVFESAQVNLGNLTPQLGDNLLSVEILEVNNIVDALPSGNMREHAFVGFDETKPVSIHVAFDDYPLETSWQILNSNGQVLYKGSGTYDVPQISKTLCLGQGCYKFVIKDSDGICCYYGQGWYTVTSESGEIFASGGEFSVSETTEFCIITSNTDDAENEFLKVFPNPTSYQAHVFLGDTAANIKSIRVVDAMGKTLLQNSDFNTQSRVWTFETNSFSAGMYLVVIETNIKTVVRKISVVK